MMPIQPVLRTVALSAIALTLSLACQPRDHSTATATAPRLDVELWQEYQQRFIRDGRVIDHGNHGISHSEGQGYGMLLAEAAADRRQFDALWAWTQKVLQRPDGLFAWRYEPCPSQDRGCISDSNNATDAELLIAWALLRAHQRWQQPEHLRAARTITAAVADKLLIERDGHLFILPGMQGFHEQGLLTLNGSYWVFPALEAFADAFPSQPWSRVMESGHWLLAQARFGEANLPPDWLELSESGLDTSRKFPPRYGYDAVRIPLHLAWSRTGIHPEQLAPFETFWQSHDPTPAWINLQNNHLADHPWSSGMSAIATLARQRAGLIPFGTDLPQAGEEEDYFSWSLSLLSHIAAEEMPL